ncbi:MULTISPECIES: formate dehydrogenase accessory protein FdhE [unclassified Bartonella]|uniref:formate dehydrogenase accessory protein FdhE n=1 Tax=unclassified Bartonella TaxID=2645622 RepID=UPI000999F179|nr:MULTISPECIES: formate dehydrogenase accessory protein FdhE [unclassified Bartonella]AQX22066.1 FdhE protein [Bartonella sp. 11B]AQX24656.1 FdhE protein [Bartonella sp. 114]AQX25834.1 FdhE protein [Bartonella sp. Coyote22sub2]
MLHQKDSEGLDTPSTTHTPFMIKFPESEALFAKRAQCFTSLATTHSAKDTLLFLAHFCTIQQQSVKRFKDFSRALARFSTMSTPFIDRSKILELGFYESVVHDFLNNMSIYALPVKQKEALSRMHLRQDQWRLWGSNILNCEIPLQQEGEHLFITGVLQIIYSLAASQLNTEIIKIHQQNLCPSCRGTHSASIVVETGLEEGTRLCSCLYCGTLWHYPLLQCTFCESIQNVSSSNLDKSSGAIVVETCQTCQRSCNRLDLHKDPSLDVFADDIAYILDHLSQSSLPLKLGAFNPFLAVYINTQNK